MKVVAVVMVNDAVKCVEAYNPEIEDEQAIRNRHYQDQLAKFKQCRPDANPVDHLLEVGFVHVHVHKVRENRNAQEETFRPRRRSMATTTKKRITTTTTEQFTISASQIREAFKLPPNAKVVFHVPGGGDWSNEDIELDDGDEQLQVVVETTTQREE